MRDDGRSEDGRLVQGGGGEEGVRRRTLYKCSLLLLSLRPAGLPELLNSSQVTRRGGKYIPGPHTPRSGEFI